MRWIATVDLANARSGSLAAPVLEAEVGHLLLLGKGAMPACQNFAFPRLEVSFALLSDGGGTLRRLSGWRGQKRCCH